MRIRYTLIIALAFSGCTRYAPRAPKPITLYLQQVDASLADGTWLSTYNALPEDTPAQVAHKTRERNRIITEFLWVIDFSYDRFETQFYAGTATQDIVGDFIQMGLGGAGSIAGGERVKSILAMSAALAGGGKASIDAHWLDKQTRYAVVSEMQALRSNQMAVIEWGTLRDLQSYSLDQGIRDCQEYYMAGSVVAALQAIASTAGAAATAAKQALQNISK